MFPWSDDKSTTKIKRLEAKITSLEEENAKLKEYEDQADTIAELEQDKKSLLIGQYNLKAKNDELFEKLKQYEKYSYHCLHHASSFGLWHHGSPERIREEQRDAWELPKTKSDNWYIIKTIDQAIEEIDKLHYELELYKEAFDKIPKRQWCVAKELVKKDDL